MEESIWWLYLVGAIAAYWLVSWRFLLKWGAVLFCAALAYAHFTDAELVPMHQWIGAVFFSGVAILVARIGVRRD